MSRIVNLILLIAIVFNAVTYVKASESGSFMNKISRTVQKIKGQLLEFFYRFRSFFGRHSESSHHLMTSRGCGYAVDDEPMIYNKHANVIAKIKGGDEAIWHTW